MRGVPGAVAKSTTVQREVLAKLDNGWLLKSASEGRPMVLLVSPAEKQALRISVATFKVLQDYRWVAQSGPNGLLHWQQYRLTDAGREMLS